MANKPYAPSVAVIFIAGGLALALAVGVALVVALPIEIHLPVICTACNTSSNITIVHVSIVPGASSPTSTNWYSPDNITVIIGVNNTVEWTNNDQATHTVTEVNGTFDSGDIAPGQTFTYNFTTPGVFPYYCTIHPWMHGTVTVKQGIPSVRIDIPVGASNPPTPWNQSHLVSNLYYDPAEVVVVIGVNNTITWVNTDSVAHTVTADNGSFDSGNLAPGASWTHTFTTPGTYRYYCTYHLWMGGEVVVLPSATSNSTSQG